MISSAVSAGGGCGFTRDIRSVGFCAISALGWESAGGGGVSERHATSALEGLEAGGFRRLAAIDAKEETETLGQEVVDGCVTLGCDPEHGGWRSGGTAMDAPRGEGS